MIYHAIQKALKMKKSKKSTFGFIFGKGNSAQKIVKHLESVPLDKDLIQKELMY